jgi:hypothetical protein
LSLSLPAAGRHSFFIEAKRKFFYEKEKSKFLWTVYKVARTVRGKRKRLGEYNRAVKESPKRRDLPF